MVAYFRNPKMTTRNFYRLAIASGLLSLLAACGGGSENDSTPVVDASTDTAQQAAFATSLIGGLKALNTYGGLTSAGFIDLFDKDFLDAGYTKTEVQANLAQEATALAVAPELSSFPIAMLSNVTITGCNAANICTLTGTVTNTDVDTTAITFTIQVKYSNGKFTLYGDQLNA